MADSIDSLPFKITINDTNEHEVIIHPSLQASMGDYFFLDITSGIVQIGVPGRAISSGNGTYDADVNSRCVLSNKTASFRYKASAVGAVIVGSA
jgi:hypothetical protein